MKRWIGPAGIGCLLAFGAGPVRAAGCDGLAQKVKQTAAQQKAGNPKVTGLFSKLAVLFGEAEPTPANVDCSSVVVAVQNLADSARIGGRGLEPPTALDRAAAQAEVDSALRKPEVQQAIKAIHDKYADDDVRLLMEAAVFDADGSYAARDLRLAQLREKLGS